MKLYDYLKNNNVNIPRDILEKVVEKHFPTIGDRFKLSKEAAVSFILHVDLPEKDIHNIVVASARLSKIWMFS